MKELCWLSLALLVVGLAVWGGSQTAWAQASTTTYFMHGYGSSAKAERQMTNYLVEQGISNTVVLVSVDRTGYATLHGSVGKNAVNPLVKVEFADSRNTDFHQDGQWLRAAIAEGQKVTHTKQINLVGHSMGNLTTLAYLNDNLSSAARPEVAHLVFLAGGLFEEMTTDVAGHLTKRLPANLAVLNVYSTGD